MIKRSGLSRGRLGFFLLAAAASACAPSAVVVVSPDYVPSRVKTAALASFADFPGAAGSGAVAENSFEQRLLAIYPLVDPGQADALAIGALTDYTDASNQTVMVDIPQEQSDPIYGQVVTTQHAAGVRVTSTQSVVTGYATTESDQVVPETESVPAHVAMNVRLVNAKTNELLWSVSSSGDGDDLASATDAASAAAMQAVAKKLQKIK